MHPGATPLIVEDEDRAAVAQPGVVDGQLDDSTSPASAVRASPASRASAQTMVSGSKAATALAVAA
jgi:hypothetical protein